MIWLGIALGVAYFAWMPLSCWAVDKAPYGTVSDSLGRCIATLMLVVAGLLFSGSLFALGLVPNELVGSVTLLIGSLGYAAGFRWITKRWMGWS